MNMKSVPKLIRRFLAILMLSIILLFFLNIVVLITLNLQQTPGASPWTTAVETGAALQKTEEGDGYVLPKDASLILSNENVWGMLIDDHTHG